MRISPFPIRLYWHAFNLIAPAGCPVCHCPHPHHARAILCPGCRPSLAPKPRCQACGRILPDLPGLRQRRIDSCRFCRTQKPWFRQMTALAFYRHRWREAILAFKREEEGDLTWQMAHLLLRRTRRHLSWERIGALVPIPARRREDEHPAFRLTQAMAAISQKPFSPILRFSKTVPPQRGLSRRERLVNMRQALSLRRRIPCETLLLVDDVFTTGATLQEGARALLAAGAREVYAAVLAQGWSE